MGDGIEHYAHRDHGGHGGDNDVENLGVFLESCLHISILFFLISPVKGVRISLYRCQRVDDVDDKDIGGEDDEVHRQADTEEVFEAVAAGAVDEHVSG